MSTTTDDSIRFPVGTQWMIKDLTTETGKKFNGKTCVVVSIFDASTGRVGVRIKNVRNRGRTLNIKPINLHDDPSITLMEGVKETTPQEAEDVEESLEKIKQEIKNKGGRPREGGTYKKDKHPYGRDPLGDDDRTKPRKRQTRENATSSIKVSPQKAKEIVNGVSSKRKVLKENDMLNEENLLSDREI